MTEKVQALVERLGGVNSIDQIGACIELMRAIYDVEHVVYYAVSLGQSAKVVAQPVGGRLSTGQGFWRRDGRSLAALSYTDMWAMHYAEEGYARIDPTLAGALQSFVPVDWKAVPWDTAKRRAFLREAISAGVGNQGYTVPVRGPDNQFAAFTINKTCSDHDWKLFIEKYASDFLIIAHYLHQQVLKIENLTNSNSTINLSARECEVLTRLSIGRSRAQIAYDLQISENTLRVYLDSARHKLGALNVPHAVSIAASRGILNT